MTEIIVALIGAVASVAAVIITNNSANKKIKAEVENISKHNKEQYLAILRLTITADHVPVSERIIAGDKYIKLGGNGDVKAYYEQFLKDHIKQEEE